MVKLHPGVLGAGVETAHCTASNSILLMLIIQIDKCICVCDCLAVVGFAHVT